MSQREYAGPAVTPPNAVGYKTVKDFGRGEYPGMEAGKSGLPGTVIPHATAGGVPQGTNPHDTSKIIMRVDPQRSDNPPTMALGDITKEIAAEAMRLAQEELPPPDGDEQKREFNAVVMENVARLIQQQPKQADPETVVPVKVAEALAPIPQRPAATPQRHAPSQGMPMHSFVPQPQATPMPQFNYPQPAASGETPMLAALYGGNGDGGFPQTAVSAPEPPRSVLVKIEVQGMGSITASYHDVLLQIDESTQRGLCVLVLDNRQPAGMRYVPEYMEGSPPMAINVVGAPEIFMAKPLGLKFTHADYEYCLLAVEYAGNT